MLNSKAIFVATALLAVLGGCTSYRTTVENQMQGRTPDEKRAILAQECGSEIAKGLKDKHPSNARHVEAMKQICEEMTGKKVGVALPENETVK
ncbi:MAG: hypothetical protein IPI58_00780 [Alphaproteobacteria bacterium]|nr:MAG: hypothetical protein IPI58_00780 [Alphaproteobacteria bacterium]